MSSVDKRIVEMVFDNAQFERGIKTSISSLDKLNQSLKLDDSAKQASKSISSLNGIDLSNISAGVESLARRFSTFGIMGMEVIQRITNSILNMGAQIKAITFDKVFQAGKNRAMNIEQARFMLHGLIDDQKEIDQIESDAMQSVNDTAYTFDAAAKAASQFAATGMRGGEEMQHALGGITGAAAMTNSEYEDMSRIFTTVAGNGKLMGDQLMQFSSRGMNVAANMKDYFNDVNTGAKEASDSVKEAIKSVTGGRQITEADFREMVSKGKISFEMFSESMYQLYGQHAKKANETLTGVMANTGAALSKMGQLFYLPLVERNGPLVKFFDTLRKQIYEIRKFLDPIMVALSSNLVRTIERATGLIAKIKLPTEKDSWVFTRNMNSAFDTLFTVGRGILNIFKILGNSINNFKDGLSGIKKLIGGSKINIFFDNLKEGAKSFEEFTKSSEGVKKFTNIFNGLLHAFNLAKSIVKAFFVAISPITNAIKSLFGVLFDGVAAFGEWITKVDQSTAVHKTIITVALNIKNALSDVIGTLGVFKDKIVDVFSSIREWLELNTDFGNFFKNVKEGLKDAKELSPWTKVATVVKSAFKGLWESLKFLQPVFEGMAKSFKGAFGTLKEAIIDIFTGKGFGALLQVVNSGFLMTLYSKITKFFTLLFDRNGSVVGFKTWAERFGISGALRDLQYTLEGFQATLKAEVIKQLAISIGIMAASIILIAQIEPKKLFTAVGAISALIGVFTIAMKVLNGRKVDMLKDSINRLGSAFSTNMLGTAALKFAGSIGILAVALKLLSMMKWEDIGKGLIVITALLTEMVIALKLLPSNSALTGIGLMEFGLSMLAMAGVLKILSTIDTEQIQVALLGLIGALLSIVVALNAMKPVKAIGNALALLVIIPTLLTIAGVMKILSTNNLEQSCIALVALGGSLGAIVLSLNKIKMLKALPNAIALTMIVPLLATLAGTIRAFSVLNLEQSCIALMVLGVSLAEVVMAINNIKIGKALVNAAALLVLIPSLMTLSGVIVALSGISVEQACIALLALGGAMTVIVMALNKMKPAKAVINAIALSKLAVTVVLIAYSLSQLASLDMDKVGSSLLALGGAMAEFILFATILGSTKGIKGSYGMVAMAASLNILASALVTLSSLNLKHTAYGLLALAAALVVIAGASYLTSLIPGLATSIFKLGISLMAVATSIALFCTAVLAFSIAMSLFAASGTAGAIAVIGAFAVIADGIVEIAPKVRAAIVAIIAEILIAIQELAPIVAATIVSVILSVLTEISNNISDIVEIIGEIILGILEGISDFIESHGEEIRSVLKDLLINVLYLACEALIDLVDFVWGAIKKFFTDLWNKFLDLLGINSPSEKTEYVGQMLMEGLLNGITGFFDLIAGALDSLCELIFFKLNPVGEYAGKIGEEIYDALHEDAGADNMIERKRKEAALQMHQQGVKSADFTDDDLLKYYLKQLERIDAGEITDVNGMDQMFKDYYASLPAEAKKVYSETSSIASEAGKDSANQYNASHYAEIEKSKSQREVQATEYYRPNEAAATEAGSRDAQMYNSNHYAEIAKASSTNTKSAQNYYDPYTDIAKKYGLDSGMFYDKNTASGMDKYINIVNTSGINVGKEAVTGAKSQQKEFRNVGVQYDLGLAQGIQNNNAQGAVIVSVKKLAARMVSEMRKSLDEHSPSRIAEDIGEFFVLGLRNGIVDTEHAASDAVNNLGQNIVSKMSDSLESTDVEDQFTNIQDAMYKVANLRADDLGMDLNPTISPVLSLDNIQNGMATLDSLFSTDRSIALSQSAYQQWQPDQGSMLDSMNQNNTKIVQAISDIRGDISKLENSMAKMRIFLDSGALVGGIITDVDNSLGNIAFMKRRTGGGM